ncbi:MAG: ribosome recycling factor [Planctomycetota bacterium JB042]
MNYDQILRETKDKMRKGVEHFQDEIRGLRSGRATPAMVEHLKVEAYGSPTPLNQLASIAIPEPRAIVIKPYDQSILKDIEKAIQVSDLGINPQSDGKVVRLTVPEMSEEQRKKMVGRIKDLSEASKVSLRNIRRDMNKRADESKELTDDDVTAAKDEIQKVLKSSESEVEELFKAKTTEIMET